MAFRSGGCMLWCSILFKKDLVWSAIMMCGFHVEYHHMRRLTKPGFDSVANYLFPFHKQTLQADRSSFFCWLLLPFQVTHRCVCLCLQIMNVQGSARGGFLLSSTNLELWCRYGGVKGSRQVLDGLINTSNTAENKSGPQGKNQVKLSCLKKFHIRFQSDFWLSSKTLLNWPL